MELSQMASVTRKKLVPSWNMSNASNDRRHAICHWEYTFLFLHSLRAVVSLEINRHKLTINGYIILCSLCRRKNLFDSQSYFLKLIQTTSNIIIQCSTIVLYILYYSTSVIKRNNNRECGSISPRYSINMIIWHWTIT